MSINKVSCVFNRSSIEKYTDKNISKPASAASKKIFRNARKANSGIKKVIITGHKNRKDPNNGGVDVIIIRQKKYLFLPGKKEVESLDNTYLKKQTQNDIQQDIKNLYAKCKRKLSLS